MTTKGPHFVNDGGLPENSGKRGIPEKITSERNNFHDALLAILDKGKLTDANVIILEENMGVVSLQQLLDSAKMKKLTIDASASQKHINRYMNDVRSRIIQSLINFGIRYALSDKKTINPDMIPGDTREITINHSMIETLKRQINT